MGGVTDFAARLPHLTVQASDGVHVIPVATALDVIAGRKPASVLTEPVLQRILEEWLGRASN